MAQKRLAVLAGFVLGAFALTACGGGGSVAGSTSGDPKAINFEATDGISYTQTDVKAPASSDAIFFNNPSSVPHDVVIEDADGNTVAQTDTVSGDTTETDAALDPGTYTFYCSVGDHRAQGMEGTLTIE